MGQVIGYSWNDFYLGGRRVWGYKLPPSGASEIVQYVLMPDGRVEERS